MEKVSIQDLSVVLIERSGLKKKDADAFVTAIFELIKEGVAQDRLVKVKGLGTFKIIDIEPRESVNVNTGERVLIEGHSKLTFTPDATLKELVNKPFSQFETVVLNDGVVFDDLNEQPVSDSGSEQLQKLTPEPNPESVPEPDSEPVPEPDPEPVPEPNQEPDSELVPEPVHESEPAPEPMHAVKERPEVQQDVAPELNGTINEIPEYMTKRQTWIGLCMAVLACILSFFVGYFMGDRNHSAVSEDTVVTQHSVDAKDTVTAEKDSIKEEALYAEPDSVATTEASDTVAAPVPVATAKDSVAAEEEVSFKTYEKMDARVRTGAYRIVGTAYEEKVRAGDNLQKISRRTLGPGMECYVEVYNGMKASTVLTEGQTVKIPKLVMKKIKK